MTLFFSCKDENLAPIITFDQAGKGAYPRLLTESDSRDLNLFDLANSSYTYSIEFVDLEQGNLVAEYYIDVIYQDNNPDNGDKSGGPTRLKSFSASDFETNESGFKALSNITITASDLMSLFSTNGDELLAGDKFIVKGFVVTTDGSLFGKDNSSAAINGSAFRGHFDFTLAASCPTNLAGTYDVNVTASWCGELPLPSRQITLTLKADGYEVDDFSFGAYDNCYGETSARPEGNLRMVDICNKISITGASQWGEVYTWSNFVVDGNVLSFDWVNDYGEGGSAEVINPNGWPPLVLE